jgi:hypothetical protein
MLVCGCLWNLGGIAVLQQFFEVGCWGSLNHGNLWTNGVLSTCNTMHRATAHQLACEQGLTVRMVLATPKQYHSHSPSYFVGIVGMSSLFLVGPPDCCFECWELSIVGPECKCSSDAIK